MSAASWLKQQSVPLVLRLCNGNDVRQGRAVASRLLRLYFGRSALLCEVPFMSPLVVPTPSWESGAVFEGERVPSECVVIDRVEGAVTLGAPLGFVPVVAAPPFGFSAVGLAALELGTPDPACWATATDPVKTSATTTEI
jgi:hypothetical protein